MMEVCAHEITELDAVNKRGGKCLKCGNYVNIDCDEEEGDLIDAAGYYMEPDR